METHGFDDKEEGIRHANASNYGLATCAFMNSLARAFHLMETLEAGTVGINNAVPSTSQCPFGGFKQSGLGRELGTEGMDTYLETRYIPLGGLRWK